VVLFLPVCFAWLHVHHDVRRLSPRYDLTTNCLAFLRHCTLIEEKFDDSAYFNGLLAPGEHTRGRVNMHRAAKNGVLFAPPCIHGGLNASPRVRPLIHFAQRRRC